MPIGGFALFTAGTWFVTAFVCVVLLTLFYAWIAVDVSSDPAGETGLRGILEQSVIFAFIGMITVPFIRRKRPRG